MKCCGVPMVYTLTLNGLVEQQAVCGGGVVHTVFKGNGIRLSHGHLFCDSGVCTAWSECRGDGTQSIWRGGRGEEGGEGEGR